VVEVRDDAVRRGGRDASPSPHRWLKSVRLQAGSALGRGQRTQCKRLHQRSCRGRVLGQGLPNMVRHRFGGCRAGRE
jgi:hypothetical protein